MTFYIGKKKEVKRERERGEEAKCAPKWPIHTHTHKQAQKDSSLLVPNTHTYTLKTL